MTSPTRRWNMFVALLLTFSVVVLGGLLQLWSAFEDGLSRRADDKVMRQVVMAATDLQPGVAIQAADIRLALVPEGAMLPQHHDEEAGIDWEVRAFGELDDVAGRIPRLPILAGELVRPERLAHGPTGRGLNALIVPRMRAYSVGISGDNALAGLLEPSSVVDILVQERNEDARLETEVLLQGVLVLAVNARLEGEEKTASRQRSSASVTFLLSPEEIESLAARASGSLSLVLRNRLDVEQKDYGSLSMKGVWERFAPTPKPEVKMVVAPRKRPKAPSRQVANITLHEGSKAQVVPIEIDDEPTEEEL